MTCGGLLLEVTRSWVFTSRFGSGREHWTGRGCLRLRSGWGPEEHWTWRLVVEGWQHDDEEGRRKEEGGRRNEGRMRKNEEGESRRKETIDINDIKSNNPHLTGAERMIWLDNQAGALSGTAPDSAICLLTAAGRYRIGSLRSESLIHCFVLQKKDQKTNINVALKWQKPQVTTPNSFLIVATHGKKSTFTK